MNTDCKLIWESYELLTELTVSKANVQRLITTYGVDEPSARALIDRFNKVESIIVKRDIFAYANLAELETAIATTKTKATRIEEGVKVIFENDIVKVLQIKSKLASIKHGRGTSWCISYDDTDDEDQSPYHWDEGDDGDFANTNAFPSHVCGRDSIFFVISKTDKQKFAVLRELEGSYGEIKDKDNEDASLQSILSMYNLPESVFDYKPYTEQEIKDVAIAMPHTAMAFAKDTLKRRWPEAESVIASHPWTAAEYAIHILKRRWPEAEPEIMTGAAAALEYAKHILKGRWPEAEPLIMTKAREAQEYATDVIKGRWPEAEPIIATDSHIASRYAISVLKHRWPEAEPEIMKSAWPASDYAINVIKGRWLEAEPIILLKNPPYQETKYYPYAIEYARRVLRIPDWRIIDRLDNYNRRLLNNLRRRERGQVERKIVSIDI